MFTRQLTRSIRSIPSRRFLSTSSSHSQASSSSFNRNAVIGLTTLAVAGLTITSERRRVLNDDRVRESVLDQGSLKRNVHKRETSSATEETSNTESIKAAAYEKAKDVKDKVVEKTQEVKDEVSKDTSSSSSSSSTPPSDEASHIVEEKSAEAAQPSQGAFNEETGEINWDCPCLGGMADGPCGEEFKAAFSCFIYSEAEPKGVDCVEKFKHMQDCFRAHPEIYGEEIDDDEEPLADAPNPADEGVTIKEDDKVPS
ncbi:hypothetical protein I302_107758 [Kwoniella bestiolae CBS 10118]|uniref:Mitochondrial intermembrane space import and assembly protein 40 n=1 Tax=Kwoniella bestiolae CBS 10118 TaxID=1296100 RepID=A0A1B9FXP0_9TREE|nr:hypothetical protein I302_06503 [Kwoniella bestiolae CBS 10118]OCF23520.1 hypothetical protein I302_06503 [Kwoniella bestiolae CBS 10118]